MTQKKDVVSSNNDPQFVAENKSELCNQEMNWKKARETMAQQAKKIGVLEKDHSKSDTQKKAVERALEALMLFLDSPNHTLRLEAAKLILAHASK